MKLKPVMWTLDDALALVREIQPLTRDFNYHLVIGGSVVNNGESRKDLDLYFLPLCNGNLNDSIGMQTALVGLFGPGEPLGSEDTYEHDPRWFKTKFMRGKQRIDSFIWK